MSCAAVKTSQRSRKQVSRVRGRLSDKEVRQFTTAYRIRTTYKKSKETIHEVSSS